MCVELEAANSKGNSRQLFQIVKSMTRNFQPRLQCIQSATGDRKFDWSCTNPRQVERVLWILIPWWKEERNWTRILGASKSLHHFVQRLLVQSRRLRRDSRAYWTECTEYVWRSGKLVSGHMNGRSPRSSHFPINVNLAVCKLQNNCSCLTCKQDLSSGHTGKDPRENLNRNCRRTGGIPTRNGDKRTIANLRILMHKACEHQQPLYSVLCGLQEGIQLYLPY